MFYGSSDNHYHMTFYPLETDFIFINQFKLLIKIRAEIPKVKKTALQLVKPLNVSMEKNNLMDIFLLPLGEKYKEM